MKIQMSYFAHFKRIFIALCVLATPPGFTATERQLDPALDTQNLPQSGGLLTWSGQDQIVAYRNIEKLLPTREISAGPYTLPLPKDIQDFSGLRYEVGGQQFSVSDYMSHNEVAGLLILKEGKILLEEYRLGNYRDTRWITFSVAKSVTSMLIGAAIADGYIASVNEKVTNYLPQLKGSSYDDVTIKNLLQMTSGVEWDETYADPNSDVANIPDNLIDLYKMLGNKPRAFSPGEHFNYNTAETNLAGAVLRAAIGNNMATYLTHKIWRPFGMEASANWLTRGSGGGERGGCCISATLRDYGRLAIFAMKGGILPDGSQVLPKSWMAQSTTPSKANDSYGYLWWLDGDQTYRALGIYGQSIHINPAADLIAVSLGAWSQPQSQTQQIHRAAFLDAVDTKFDN